MKEITCDRCGRLICRGRDPVCDNRQVIAGEDLCSNCIDELRDFMRNFKPEEYGYLTYDTKINRFNQFENENFKCSACDKKIEDPRYKYCPYCGVRFVSEGEYKDIILHKREKQNEK